MHDDYTVEYHLMSHDWIKGRTAYMGALKGVAVQPDGCLVTVVQHTYQASGYSKEQITCVESWRSAEAPALDLEKLLEKYPLPPS
jgi:hypothetical protein